VLPCSILTASLKEDQQMTLSTPLHKQGRGALLAAWLTPALMVCACSSEPTAPAAPPPAGDTPVPVAAPRPEGATPAPAPEPAAAPAGEAIRSDVPETIEGADRTMEQATIDGFETSKVQCKTEGGLFAGMAILGGLAAQKEVFAGCSEKSETVRVHFVNDGARTTDIRVADASTPAVARCVAGAVAEAALPTKCTCVVSFEIGPPGAAR
jgi:hypothetical protein